MLKCDLWCPEEDVELPTFLFNYSYLILIWNWKAVPKAVLICALHQGDFVADTQNRTLTVLMPEVCYADEATAFVHL